MEVIKECKKRGVPSVEPKAEAEEAWVDTIVKSSTLNKEFFTFCTPGVRVDDVTSVLAFANLFFQNSTTIWVYFPVL